MSKVTSKYQVTVPKRIADHYAIRPGDEIDWVPAGDVIRVIPPGNRPQEIDREFRLRLFDQASERHRSRPAPPSQRPPNRGWTREELYDRGHAH